MHSQALIGKSKCVAYQNLLDEWYHRNSRRKQTAKYLTDFEADDQETLTVASVSYRAVILVSGQEFDGSI